jgi:hypothetical protein
MERLMLLLVMVLAQHEMLTSLAAAAGRDAGC